MSVVIEGSIEGEQQLSRRLMVMSDGLNDFSEPLQASATELMHSFDTNFASEGQLFGGWEARKQDYPWPILQRTGFMKGNFQSDVGRDEAVLTNPTDYFPYHQSNAPRTKLPRRVMMKIDQERKVFIQKAFQAYIIMISRK